jgi:3-oxoacyl-[acyl-carrier protein] reductase
MIFDFSGQTILVTGASRGIGRAIADMLLSSRGEVIITSTGNPPDWMSAYPGRVRHLRVDFCDRGQLEGFLQQIDALEKIDVLINNAGVNQPRLIRDASGDVRDRLHAINLDAPFLIAQHVAEKMAHKGSGRIVNISSIAGVITRPGNAVYSMTKAGILSLTRSLAVEYAGQGVLVNAVCPGYTDTEMMDSVLTPEQRAALQSTVPLGRFLQPREVARTVVFLSSGWNTYMTGQSLIIDGGVTIQ